MRRKSRVLTSCAAAVAGVLCAAQPSSAIESADNKIPWVKNGTYVGTASYYSAGMYNGAGFMYENISPSGDVDYHVVSCGKAHLMTDLGINLTHANGDLDIEVFTVDGDLVGSSAGVGNFEHVSLSGRNTSAAIVKVVGWAGATNKYNVNVNCF